MTPADAPDSDRAGDAPAVDAADQAVPASFLVSASLWQQQPAPTPTKASPAVAGAAPGHKKNKDGGGVSQEDTKKVDITKNTLAITHPAESAGLSADKPTSRLVERGRLLLLSPHIATLQRLTPLVHVIAAALFGGSMPIVTWDKYSDGVAMGLWGATVSNQYTVDGPVFAECTLSSRWAYDLCDDVGPYATPKSPHQRLCIYLYKMLTGSFCDTWKDIFIMLCMTIFLCIVTSTIFCCLVLRPGKNALAALIVGSVTALFTLILDVLLAVVVRPDTSQWSWVQPGPGKGVVALASILVYAAFIVNALEYRRQRLLRSDAPPSGPNIGAMNALQAFTGKPASPK